MKKRSKKALFIFVDAIVIFLVFTLPNILKQNALDFGFKNCFNTPDLFERSGLNFAKGFLFELPIAVARWTANTGLIPIVAILVILSIAQLMSKEGIEEK